jgi:hypothetical protein
VEHQPGDMGGKNEMSRGSWDRMGLDMAWGEEMGISKENAMERDGSGALASRSTGASRMRMEDGGWREGCAYQGRETRQTTDRQGQQRQAGLTPTGERGRRLASTITR